MALALALLRDPLAGLFDGVRELAVFADRAIGQTTMLGLDASGYARNYVRLQAVLAAVILGLAAILVRVRTWLDRHPAAAGPELTVLSRLGEVWIALEIIGIFRPEKYSYVAADLVAATVLAVGLLIAVRVRVARPGRAEQEVRRVLDDRPLVTAMALLSLVVPFVVWGLLGVSPSLAVLPRVGWFVVVVSTWCGLLVGAWRLGGGRRATDTGRLVAAGVPLLLAPACLPLANELQYSLASWAPESLARLALLLLVVASVLLARLLRNAGPSARRSLHAAYFPLLIVIGDLLRIYPHNRYLGKIDYFHLGESMVPTQQLFRFGRLPILDLLPAHSFSDLAFPTLYSLVHGYHGLDMELWAAWMPELLALLLIYFVVARVASPLVALLAGLFLPVLGAAAEYYALVLVPALLLARVVGRPSLRRYMLLAASLVALTLWRFDFGLVGALAGALVLTAQNVPWRRFPAHRFRLAGAAFAVVAVATAGTLVSALILAGRPLGDAVVQLSAFYGSRLLTRTRPELIAQLDAMAVLQYYLLPAISVAILVGFALRRQARRRASPNLSMVAFLATFSLIISVRSLERHSLIEAFNPYLFVFLLALVPFLGGPGLANRPARHLGFITVLVANAVLLTPTSLHQLGRHATWHVIPDRSELFRFHRWRGDERRVEIAELRHRALVRFLDEQLGPEQTFFDFTNSPLLYAITDRRFPTYLIPNLVHTSEAVQARVVADLESLRVAGRLPFVVFKQGHEFWDQTDGVPNEVRSYRVAELIYRHYEPLARFGGYEVWRERGARPAVELLAQYVERRELATSGVPRLHAMAPLEEQATFRVLGDDPWVAGVVDLASGMPVDGSRSWALDLEYASSVPGDLQVFFDLDGVGFTPEASAWVKLRSGEGRQLVTLPAGAADRRLTDLRFDPPLGSTFAVRRLALLDCSAGVVPLPGEAVTQDFELARLPWVWATRDPNDALRRTSTVAALVSAPLVVAPDNRLELTLPASAQAPTVGYLRLRARGLGESKPDRPPRVRVSYGEHLDGGFGFEVVRQVSWDGEVELPRRERWVGHEVSSFWIEGARLIFEPQGPDPQIVGLFDTSGVRELTVDDAVDLVVAYRSRVAGQAQVFLARDGGGFDEAHSAWFAVERTTDLGPPAVARLRLLERGEGFRLSDLRFDPPAGLFELVGVTVELRRYAYEDYLVRLSTQWGWWNRPGAQLSLAVSSPLEIADLELRSRD